MNGLNQKRRRLFSTVGGAAVTAQGQCGNNVYWKLYDTGFMYIYGTGHMYETYYWEWDDYKNEIRSVVIAEGVESVGGYSFRGCSNLKSVKLPNSLVAVREAAFRESGITEINIPKNVLKIENQVFRECMELTRVVIQTIRIDSMKYLVFQYSVNITDLYVPWSEGAIANAPWSATNATIHYDTVYDENGEPITQ